MTQEKHDTKTSYNGLLYLGLLVNFFAVVFILISLWYGRQWLLSIEEDSAKPNTDNYSEIKSKLSAIESTLTEQKDNLLNFERSHKATAAIVESLIAKQQQRLDIDITDILNQAENKLHIKEYDSAITLLQLARAKTLELPHQLKKSMTAAIDRDLHNLRQFKDIDTKGVINSIRKIDAEINQIFTKPADDSDKNIAITNGGWLQKLQAMLEESNLIKLNLRASSSYANTQLKEAYIASKVSIMQLKTAIVTKDLELFHAGLDTIEDLLCSDKGADKDKLLTIKKKIKSLRQKVVRHKNINQLDSVKIIKTALKDDSK